MSVPGSSEQEKDHAGEGIVEPSVRRVLVYRLGSLGDTLVALPSLHLVARAFPNAERRMLTNLPVASRAPAAAAVLGDSGLIHSYEHYTVGLRKPAQLVEMLLRLRRFRPEVVVYLKATNDFRVARRDALYLRLTGARRIVGLPLQAEDCEQQLVLGDGTFEPESYRLARTLEALGDAQIGTSAAWDLRLSAQEKARADASTRALVDTPYFAVSVGTKVQAKDWGVRNWRELLHALASAYPGYGLLLAGAREEHAASEAAAEGWRAVRGAGVDVNVCGAFSPRETAAAFRHAKLFIGHDSGPMHLAAVMGIPTVAVFSARNQPRTWFPVGAPHCVVYHRVDCWGCGLETCIDQRKKCILSITVQEVMAAVRQAMQSATCDTISVAPDLLVTSSLYVA